jgi:LDH2 family malate/lactate/ureidoglycolate dehydrogenase
MQRYPATFLRTIATDVFAAIGTPTEEAAIVAEHLVASNLVGLDSHGVVRIPQYADWVRAGTIRPRGRISVVKEEAATAVLDCGYNFG